MACLDLVPIVSASNLEATLAFYTDQLGFTKDGEWRPEGGLSWCHVHRDSARLMLSLGHSHAEDGSSVPLVFEDDHREVCLYVYVDDVDALREEFAGRGLAVSEMIETWYGLREFGVTDPDGYAINFAQDISQRG